MITQVCVAIQLLGAPAAPEAVQALQQRCDSVLGTGECRITRDGINGDKNDCWRATLVRTVDDGMASVVVGGSGAAAGHAAQRDVTFQSNDERTDRWATLGLVIAALVTQEEHAAASTPAATATSPPAETPTGSSWFSRDRSAPATISEQPEEPSYGPLHLADLRLLGVYDSGRLPSATVGGRLSGTFGLVHHLDLEIGGAYLTSTGTISVPNAIGTNGGIHLDLRSLTLGLCPQSRISAGLSGHVCVGGDLGLMRVTATGVADSNSGVRLLPSVWVGFDSAVQLTRHLALVAEYKAEVAVEETPSIIIANVNNSGSNNRVFQPSRFSENVAVGVAGTF